MITFNISLATILLYHVKLDVVRYLLSPYALCQFWITKRSSLSVFYKIDYLPFFQFSKMNPIVLPFNTKKTFIYFKCSVIDNSVQGLPEVCCFARGEYTTIIIIILHNIKEIKHRNQWRRKHYVIVLESWIWFVWYLL